MAAASFQVVSVSRAARLPVPCQPDARAGSWAENLPVLQWQIHVGVYVRRQPQPCRSSGEGINVSLPVTVFKKSPASG